MNHSDEQEGVVIDAVDMGALAVLNKSEIDQQISTAKKYPRSIKQFRNDSMEMVTLTPEIAGECIYAVPRDGKVIEGPSARFAEIIFSAWGNSRAGARVVSEDDNFITAQGMFYDLQRNTAISYEVRRRITNKSGKKFGADMVSVTANAACSIALRNAITKGVPKAFWMDIYNAARSTAAGDLKSLANKREDALKAFVIYNVTPDEIFRTLGIKGKEDITIEHLITLKGFLTAIKEGDMRPEEIFRDPGEATAEGAKSATEAKAAELLKKHAEKTKVEAAGTSTHAAMQPTGAELFGNGAE